MKAAKKMESLRGLPSLNNQAHRNACGKVLQPLTIVEVFVATAVVFADTMPHRHFCVATNKNAAKDSLLSWASSC